MRDFTHFHPGFIAIPGFEYRIGIMKNLQRLSQINADYLRQKMEEFCPHHSFTVSIARIDNEKIPCTAIMHYIDGKQVDKISVCHSKTWKVLVPSYHRFMKSFEGKTGKYWWYLDSKKMDWKKFEKKFEVATVALV